jgi:hypothetical protein
MADVNLTVSADIGDLRRQLESIPGITAEQARRRLRRPRAPR